MAATMRHSGIDDKRHDATIAALPDPNHQPLTTDY